MPSQDIQPEHQGKTVGVSGLRTLTNGHSTEIGEWGSSIAVAQLVQQHSRYTWCLLRRLGVPVSYLDDATQQVFIVAARRLEEVTVGRERAFLCGTAVRVASNYRRAAGKRAERVAEVSLDGLQSSTPNGEALLDRMRARRMLDLVLDCMPEDLRTVFVLSELEGLTAPETAVIVECPLGTVSSRLRRARERFRAETARLREALFPEEANR